VLGGSATAYFSPNADGDLDQSIFTGTLTIESPWLVQVLNPALQVVREFPGSTVDIDGIWDGRNTGGTLQPDAVYTYKLSLPPAPGLAALTMDTSILDTVAPTAQIDTPLEGTPVLDYADVAFSGTANDLYLRRYVMTSALASSPATKTQFVNSGAEVIGGPLARSTWATASRPSSPTAESSWR
jgi:hypothetical protein